MSHSPYKIDKSLVQAYKDTDYIVLDPNITIQIARENLELEEFLIDNQIFSYCFITAFNPYSAITDSKTNQANQQSLVGKLNELNLKFLEAEGRPKIGDWATEPSLFVKDISKLKAIELMKTFNQNAIVYGKINEAPNLILNEH